MHVMLYVGFCNEYRKLFSLLGCFGRKEDGGSHEMNHDFTAMPMVLGTIPWGTSKARVVNKGGTLSLVTVGSVINEYLISVF